MRAQPFFRKQTRSWYLQLGKKQINLGKDRAKAFEAYHKLALQGSQGAADNVTTILRAYVRFVRSNRADATYR
ncbi:MAG: integrase, partial [Pirellulales bacterium]